MTKLIYLFMAICLCGCFSTGRPCDTAKVSQIKKGQTTIPELQTWFGRPFSIERRSNGETESTWQFTKAGFAVGIIEQRVLKVVADRQGVVKDFSLKESRQIGNEPSW